MADERPAATGLAIAAVDPVKREVSRPRASATPPCSSSRGALAIAPAYGRPRPVSRACHPADLRIATLECDRVRSCEGRPTGLADQAQAIATSNDP